MEGTTVPVFVEIEQHDNQKWEWNAETRMLELDRVLPHPFVYPYAYGFIPGTLAGDGDALDALIVTQNKHPLLQQMTYSVHIVGVILMEDEQGRDEKILCVLEKDWIDGIQELTDIWPNALESLTTFFATYKSNTPGKWSKVLGLGNRIEAVGIYRKSSVVLH